MSWLQGALATEQHTERWVDGSVNTELWNLRGILFMAYLHDRSFRNTYSYRRNRLQVYNLMHDNTWFTPHALQYAIDGVHHVEYPVRTLLTLWFMPKSAILVPERAEPTCGQTFKVTTSYPTPACNQHTARFAWYAK